MLRRSAIFTGFLAKCSLEFLGRVQKYIGGGWAKGVGPKKSSELPEGGNQKVFRTKEGGGQKVWTN